MFTMPNLMRGLFIVLVALSASAQSTAPSAPSKKGTSRAVSASAAGEAEAWKRARARDVPQAYTDFHKAYPSSKSLTLLTADVDSSFSIFVSANSSGTGSARGGPVEIEVKGHPELDGEYSTEYAVQLGIGAKVNSDGNIVMANGLLKDVELYIAQFGGKSRVVAAKVRENK